MNLDHQAILARDMIDMIRNNADNIEVLEYLESFASSLMYILEGQSAVNWADLAGVCDQRYYSLKQGAPVPLDTRTIDRVLRSIESDLPKEYSK